MDDKERAEEFLSSLKGYTDLETMHRRMLSASLFITLFEVLKETIIGHPRDFFSSEWGPKGPIPGPKYKSAVLSLNKDDRASASLEWWRSMNAITQDDIDAFKAARTRRNKLVHELAASMGDEWLDDVTAPVKELRDLLNRMEQWWCFNVEIPTNPDFDGEEVDQDTIIPGNIMFLDMLIMGVTRPEELKQAAKAAEAEAQAAVA